MQDKFNISESFAELIEAALNADYHDVRRIGNRTIRYFDEKGNPSAAKRIRTALRRKATPLRASGQMETLPVDTKTRMPLVEEQIWPDTPVFLDEPVGKVFHRFLEDITNSERLAKEGLATQTCLLLSGPPGTGKTLLASHVAARLGRPLYVARLDTVISSFLGETAKNIRAVFEFLSSKRAILLLDELDAVAKMRDDIHELGELKRVVNTLIQGIDTLDNYSVLIGATNHAQLLDEAIWRRFPYKAILDLPNRSVRVDLWKYFLFNDNDLQGQSSLLSLISDGLSGADIQEISLAERRSALLQDRDLNVGSIVIAAMDSTQGQPIFPQSSGALPAANKQTISTLSIEYNIKQVEIAKLFGISKQTVSKYLRSVRDGTRHK